MASQLTEVKENFLSIASKGWFLPGSTPTHSISERDERGGSRGYREAAVLCLISYHKRKLQILLTKRSSGVSSYKGMPLECSHQKVSLPILEIKPSHLNSLAGSPPVRLPPEMLATLDIIPCHTLKEVKGDACLPGGTKDSDDASLQDTALREAAEEVGLNRLQIEVICSLPPQHASKHGVTMVTAVVALAKCTPEELTLSPNPTEVDCLYWVPLELFLDLQLDREDSREWWHKLVFSYADPETETTHIIYGITALLCVSVASVALDRLPNFPYIPSYVTEVVQQGDLIATVHSDIALTQQQAAEIRHSKL